MSELSHIEHPNWYWTHYDPIFGRGKEYLNDINAVSRCVDLKRAEVQEIGAGTGEHAACIADQGVSYLQVVDNDQVAAKLLKRRFMHDQRVSVLLADGFAASYDQIFDAVICMFSVATQKCSSILDVIKRVKSVLRRIRPGGTFAFETIDYDISHRLYPPGKKTIIFRHGSNVMTIESEYHPTHLQISYNGCLDGAPCEYVVKILRTSRQELCRKIKEATGYSAMSVNLDEVGRRILVVVKKPEEAN